MVHLMSGDLFQTFSYTNVSGHGTFHICFFTANTLRCISIWTIELNRYVLIGHI